MAAGLSYKYMGAVMLGQGIAGIAANMFRALSYVIWPIAKSPDNEFKGSMAYFLLSSIFMVFCGMA